MGTKRMVVTFDVDPVLLTGPDPATGRTSTLQRHMDAKALSKLIDEGWRLVSSGKDPDGKAFLVLEREED